MTIPVPPDKTRDMHSLALVCGEDIDEILMPFSSVLPVEPYEVILPSEEVREMALHYAMSPDDLNALALKMEDWTPNPASCGKDNWGAYRPTIPKVASTGTSSAGGGISL